jgi:hypothetical protein
MTAIRPRAAHFSNGSKNKGAVGSNSTEDPGVFLDDDHGGKGLDGDTRAFLFQVNDITGRDLFVLGNTLDGHTDGVAGTGAVQDLLVLFNTENLLALETGRGNTDDITRAQGTLFNRTANNLTHSLNVVDIGNGETERCVGVTGGRDDKVVQGVDDAKTGNGLLGGQIGLPSLVPGGNVGLGDEIVAVKARIGDERDFLGLEPNQLQHLDEFVLDFVETVFTPAARVHLVHADLS